VRCSTLIFGDSYLFDKPLSILCLVGKLTHPSNHKDEQSQLIVMLVTLTYCEYGGFCSFDTVSFMQCTLDHLVEADA